MALPAPTSGNDPDPAAMPLVGQAVEGQRLDHALDQLLDTRAPSIVEVVGEPGIGKSTLLGVLARTAAERGAQVFTGRATEFAGAGPFAMFVDAFDPFLAGLERRHVARLLDEEGADLPTIFPALAERGRGHSAPADGERFRRHRAVRSLLERVATQKPAVLILDDVHWADPASAELVAALLRNPPDAPGMMALGYRPAQTPPRLAAELEAAARHGLIERVDVAPLSLEEAGALLGAKAGSAEGAAIYTASGGNPFYLQELARADSRARAPAAAPDT